MVMSTFPDNNIKGFGLVQRDRNFDHYQDLELTYETRPTYFVEPHGDWGDGRIELLELATKDETADNIVTYWTPKSRAGRRASLSPIPIASARVLDAADLSPNGRVGQHLEDQPQGARLQRDGRCRPRRFIVDFAGGDLAYFAQDPSSVEVSASTSVGQGHCAPSCSPIRISTAFAPSIDVQVEPGQSTDIRAFLHTGPHALTETWLMPWIAE